MTPVPSRDALVASVLRNLGRSETPMRYVAAQRLKNFLFKLSDVQYEEFLRRTMDFDPTHIDPKVRAAVLADIDKHDDTGFMGAMAETVFDSEELLAEGKRLLTEVTQ